VAFPVSGSRRRTFFIAILLSITLITLDTRGNPAIDKVRSVARDAFSPFQGAARAVFRPFEKTWNGIRDYDRLKRDYERAREQADANAAASIEAEARLREYADLRVERELPTCSTLPRKFADVIGRPATNYESALEISRGSRDGLLEGMPVITSGGLIGRVGKVSETRAFIKLLWEPDVQVQVQISASAGLPKDTPGILAEGPTNNGTTPGSTTSAPTTTTTTTLPDGEIAPNIDPIFADPSVQEQVRDQQNPPTTPAPVPGAPTTTTTTIATPPIEFGLMQGNGPGELLSVTLIKSGAPIRVGDPVSTVWNRSSLFPGCLPVGRVASVSPRKGTGELDVKVAPRADLSRISFVTVVLWAPDPTVGPVAPVPTTPTIPTIPPESTTTPPSG
jgi:cell shape-determining protein MreC